MTEKLLAIMFVFISKVIAVTGYAGIALLMAIESACIPLPSELIMPFAGYLVFPGHIQTAVGGDGGRASAAIWDRWSPMRSDVMAAVRWSSAMAAGF